ncbi:hypothetical protein [Xanthomonas fragariae]|uniref:hypothetical protein n=1 Tax=Xanthomonas fragariae TaxID=48664 RepID=UPI001F1C7768|nr:hypothetical protein [Xanthomonas fragariae]MDM7553362.1 hypothetical protein [Xanthomonas fragariae]MDM7556457.1 hypothetical protein [Xanthomonas fragariae]MDM7574144.1 hypothetical protein [Xanthomonas fragariae]MDM7577227.1 hypothetical protein [Xanthomonas fragariae]MDM7587387.1 hypothetical protein [Xanthomonas fragariae]
MSVAIVGVVSAFGSWSMFALMVALAVSSCATENGHYVLCDVPSVEVEFRNVASGTQWPAHVALRVHPARGAQGAWFLPRNGGSDGSQHIASITDVTVPGWHAPDPDGGPRLLGDISYVGTDADYRVLSEAPRAGAPAPAHFLLPDLREALWYRAKSDQRLDVARQFFDLDRCTAKK